MRSFILSLTLSIFIVALGWAQSKPPMSIQGTLKNGDGTSVADGRYDMTFRLYTASSGGTAVWTEFQPGVQVRAGVYSARLGSITPIDITFTENLFLGTTVGTGAEIVPRTQLTSSPYALFAFQLGNDIPAGFVMPWASGSGTAPSGWLPCDGRALKSIEYPELYNAIGTLWGNGSSGAGAGSGTDFNLPDLRGEFVRGAEAGANAGGQQGFSTAPPTSGALFSSALAGAHTHPLVLPSNFTFAATVGNTAPFSFGVGGTPSSQKPDNFNEYKFTFLLQHQYSQVGDHNHTVNPATGGDAETRPRNVALPYFIKIRK